MAKKKSEASPKNHDDTKKALVAATLAGVVYQSRLLNRQAKLNIPDQEIITDVVNTWYAVMDALDRPLK